MQAWCHCENTCQFAPREVVDRADSVRGRLPNKYCDPTIAADLFPRMPGRTPAVPRPWREHRLDRASCGNQQFLRCKSSGDSDTSREMGRRGMVNALVLRGMEGTKRTSAACREARGDAGLSAPAPIASPIRYSFMLETPTKKAPGWFAPGWFDCRPRPS